MAQNHNTSPQYGYKKPTETEKHRSNEPISYDEFVHILLGPDLLQLIYEAALSGYDVEIRFEKDGTPKIYLKKIKRVNNWLT